MAFGEERRGSDSREARIAKVIRERGFFGDGPPQGGGASRPPVTPSPREQRTSARRAKQGKAQPLDGARYLDDPIGFCRDILGVELWHAQADALSSIISNERVAVKSGNGLGKGFLSACAVLWWTWTRKPCTVITTAPTSRQVRFVLWRQIRRLYNAAVVPLGGQMLEQRWELAPDQYAMGITAADATSFQGFHSEALLVVVDEAAGVSEEIYEAVDSMATAGNPRIILIGNPTTVNGGFFRAFHRERSLVYGAYDVRNGQP